MPAHTGCLHGPSDFRSKAFAVGCDFSTGLPANYYPPFWDYCGLEFVPLSDNLALPFDDNSFDCVIGAGVLEHVAMDYESLKELYRVLKPDGRLIITNLPNKFSLRRIYGPQFQKVRFPFATLYNIEDFIDAEVNGLLSSNASTSSLFA